MQVDTISERDDLTIRRLVLAPGEATLWHVDRCHRFTVVVRGERLRIEYLDEGSGVETDVHPGLADWDAPEARTHRAVNLGATPYEEVVLFFRDPAGIDPQPDRSP